LIAIGYTMVHGIIGMINFANGKIYTIAAFISITAFLAGFDRRYLCSTHPRFADNDVLYLDFTAGWWSVPPTSVARVTQAGPANFGDRHVNFFAELRANPAGRALQADAADLIRAHGLRKRRIQPAAQLSAASDHTDHHHGADGQVHDRHRDNPLGRAQRL
jgi:hypothetical protein